MLFIIVTTIIVLIIIAYMIAVYNRFRTLKVAAETTIGQIRVVLKKRLDTISQLIDATKEYAKYERKTLEDITKMRTSVMQASPDDIQKIDRSARALLGGIRVALENYPDLKTAETVKNLMKAVKDIEDEIARQRYTYNNIVQEYNTRLVTFPSNLIGSIFNFSKLELLEFQDNIEEKPKIKIGS